MIETDPLGSIIGLKVELEVEIIKGLTSIVLEEVIVYGLV
jgi:hypothetical protein